jgi:hypothetical protein
MLGEQNGKPRRRKRSAVHHLDIARLHPAEPRANRLETLAELHERGVLSDAEYRVQRDEIIDEI